MRNTILYLARWYPHKYDPMFGLFVKRHAEAASRYCNIGVVYVHQLTENQKQNVSREIDFKIDNGIPTACVYFKPSKLPLFGKLVNIFRYFKANLAGIKKINSENGKFDLIHVHVLTRPGIIALWYKMILGTPYLISEHWSRYLDLTDNFNGKFRKIITRIVTKNATVITTVTDNLAKAMQRHHLRNRNYIVFPNVVDPIFIEYNITEKETQKVTFVHVSCFEDRSKNISGLLRVIARLQNLVSNFEFKLIGDGLDMEILQAYAKDLNIDNSKVTFTGLLEGNDLVKEISSANMLVVFSNYENMPVVINESLSLGIPVIATRVGGIPEVINNSNGVLIDAVDEEKLLENLIAMCNGKLSFSMDNIKKQAISDYSSEEIGRKLSHIYSDIIRKNTN